MSICFECMLQKNMLWYIIHIIYYHMSNSHTFPIIFNWVSRQFFGRHSAHSHFSCPWLQIMCSKKLTGDVRKCLNLLQSTKSSNCLLYTPKMEVCTHLLMWTKYSIYHEKFFLDFLDVLNSFQSCCAWPGMSGLSLGYLYQWGSFSWARADHNQ